MSYPITNDCAKNADALLEIITERNMSGEEVFNLFTDWHGTYLVSKEMCENLRDCEGFDEFEDEEDEEEDEEDSLYGEGDWL